jgi:two-component sensor histidine kinase
MAYLYDRKGNAKLAYDYLLKAKNLATTIKEKESKAKLMSLRIKFETDQKETLIQKERQKNEAISIDAQNKTSQRNTISLVLFFVVLSLGIIVIAYLNIKRKNELLHKSNSELENLAHQKQILLKEVHHRVKNNLTTLKSLLFLQAKASDNAEVKLVLEECQLRIQSMALIHQNLYEEGGKETVEFYQFIEQLFEALKLSFNPVNTEVEVNLQSNQVSLDISLALFLGLVLNELVTNSYKYAFKNKTTGKISLNLAHENGKFVVTYYDDGIGLPNGFNETTEGFGFKLIRILTQQINAKLDYTYINHLATFTIIIDDAK